MNNGRAGRPPVPEYEEKALPAAQPAEKRSRRRLVAGEVGADPDELARPSAACRSPNRIWQYSNVAILLSGATFIDRLDQQGALFLELSLAARGESA